MTVEIQRTQPSPICCVRYWREGVNVSLSAYPHHAEPDQFVVVGPDQIRAAYLSRGELREWCAGVIEMLDQGAP